MEFPKFIGGVGVKAINVVVLLLMLSSPAFAVMYKVGDSAAWTTVGNVDYKHWAATKTFLLGDVIVFQYNRQFHNVMQVKHSAFKACNASSRITTYTTGNDTITITRHGNYFFMCGVPGHCQAGQKVDIHVLKSVTSSVAPSPSVSSSAAHASATMAPTPSSAAAGDLVNPLKGLLSITAVGMVLVGLQMPFM